MSQQRKSLKDILNEDELSAQKQVSSEKLSSVQASSEKADYIKVSGTVPPELLERLNREKERRQKGKLPCRYSDIVREALEQYLPQ